MYSTYILQSEINGKLYYRSSKNPIKRLKYHNLGKQRWTKRYLPWKLIYTIEFSTKKEAILLENKLKKLKNPTYILKLIKEDKITQLVSPDLSE